MPLQYPSSKGLVALEFVTISVPLFTKELTPEPGVAIGAKGIEATE